MRISDWSSDVCSSDLIRVEPRIIFAQRNLNILGDAQRRKQRAPLEHHAPAPAQVARFLFIGDRVERLAIDFDFTLGRRLQPDDRAHQHRLAGRSEEHTSELQSLMRISYAVFCLKKKNNKTYKSYHH